jgi:hypothetical protein
MSGDPKGTSAGSVYLAGYSMCQKVDPLRNILSIRKGIIKR